MTWIERMVARHLWKKGVTMFAGLLANPTLQGYITKIGSLGFVLIGIIQLTAPKTGVALPPEFSTGLDPMLNILIGLIAFGLARKIQKLFQALEASGINVPDALEKVVNDAVAKEDAANKQGGTLMKSVVIVLALLSVFLALPAAQAADWTHGVDMLTTRADAGVTCISGCSDAGGSVGIGVNNLLAVFHENLTLKGYVVSWRDERVLEAGNVTVGYSRPSGDATGQEDGFVFLGAGAYLLEAFHLEAVYGLNNDLASNYGARISVDMPTLGTKLVAMTQKAWGYTGL